MWYCHQEANTYGYLVEIVFNETVEISPEELCVMMLVWRASMEIKLESWLRHKFIVVLCSWLYLISQTIQPVRGTGKNNCMLYRELSLIFLFYCRFNQIFL